MSPLHIEMQNINGGWAPVGEVGPTDDPGSISNNPHGKEREIYVFQCEADNSSSAIYRAIQTVDAEIGNKRIMASSVFDEVARLRTGDQPFILNVKTDMGAEAKIRFIHKER